MKTVEWFEFIQSVEGNKSFRKKVSNGKAKLLSFGVDYEELSHAAGTFSTAIIKLPDGTIRNIPVENIKFMN